MYLEEGLGLMRNTRKQVLIELADILESDIRKKNFKKVVPI